MKEQFLKVKLSHNWNWNASPSLSSVPTMESKVLIFKLSVGTFFHREQLESFCEVSLLLFHISAMRGIHLQIPEYSLHDGGKSKDRGLKIGASLM